MIEPDICHLLLGLYVHIASQMCAYTTLVSFLLPSTLSLMLYMCVASECVCGYVHVCSTGYGGQKSASDPLELEIKEVVIHLMWVLGTEC